MAIYQMCPWCGANLDPGEICDCDTQKKPPLWCEHKDGNAAEKTAINSASIVQA